MPEKKIDPKQFLRKYGYLKSELNKKLDEIEELKSRTTSITQDPSSEHVKSSMEPDKLSSVIYQLDVKKHEADNLIQQLCDTGAEIQNAICHVKNKQSRDLLTLIYIGGCSFEFAAVKMNITHRWATELHGYGLHDINNFLNVKQSA